MATNVRMSRLCKATRRGGGEQNSRPPSVLLLPLTRDTVVAQMSRNRMHRRSGRLSRMDLNIPHKQRHFMYTSKLSLNVYVYTFLFSDHRL